MKITYEDAMKNVDPQYQAPKEMMTCNECDLEKTGRCPVAWDPYNTDGDCLLDK